MEMIFGNGQWIIVIAILIVIFMTTIVYKREHKELAIKIAELKKSEAEEKLKAQYSESYKNPKLKDYITEETSVTSLSEYQKKQT